MMEEVLEEAGNWNTQEVEHYTGSCLKMELHIRWKAAAGKDRIKRREKKGASEATKPATRQNV